MDVLGEWGAGTELIRVVPGEPLLKCHSITGIKPPTHLKMTAGSFN